MLLLEDMKQFTEILPSDLISKGFSKSSLFTENTVMKNDRFILLQEELSKKQTNISKMYFDNAFSGIYVLAEGIFWFKSVSNMLDAMLLVAKLTANPPADLNALIDLGFLKSTFPNETIIPQVPERFILIYPKQTENVN